MRSTLGRWTRLAGLPAAAVVAMALVGAPAFAAASTPTQPLPPECTIITHPGTDAKTVLPEPGKPGKCVICVIKASGTGTGTGQGTTSTGTTGAGEQGGVTTGKPGECPVCPLPPGKPTTGSGQGAGTVATPPGKGKVCVICIIIKPGTPGAPSTTQPAPGKPIPGDPAKCEIHTGPATK